MAYTPTTWTTGDTITATAMNKIENGIAGAGGGYPYIHVTSAGFSNYVTLGYFAIGKYDSQNHHYYAIPASASSSYGPQYETLVVKDSLGNEYVYPSAYPSNLPEGIVLLWIQYGGNENDYTYSGEVSQLYTYYSDSASDGCRVVTGNFELYAAGI